MGGEKVEQMSWNLKDINCQTMDLDLTQTAMGKSQRFLNRDRTCRKRYVRKTQALSLVAVWGIN